jgi:hypothetical protein
MPEQFAEKLALKGRGFSHAVKSRKIDPALAGEAAPPAMPIFQWTVQPQRPSRPGIVA